MLFFGIINYGIIPYHSGIFFQPSYGKVYQFGLAAIYLEALEKGLDITWRYAQKLDLATMHQLADKGGICLNVLGEHFFKSGLVGSGSSRLSLRIPPIGMLRIVHIPEAGVLRDVPRGFKVLACTILCGATAPWANTLWIHSASG